MTNEHTPLSWFEACKKAAENYRAGRFELYPITHEAYWWGLGCVPPAIQKGGAFLCGEPYTHTIDEQGRERGVYAYAAELSEGKYYGGALLTIPQARALTGAELWAAIDAPILAAIIARRDGRALEAFCITRTHAKVIAAAKAGGIDGGELDEQLQAIS
jgi:hypothetical protein